MTIHETSTPPYEVPGARNAVPGRSRAQGMTSQPSVGRPRATTHQELLAIARGLFLERGYNATSMKSIAQAAGISRTSLFTYFRSKGDLIWGEYDQTIAALNHALATRPDNEPITEGILAALREAHDFPADEHDHVAQRWTIVDANPELHAYAAQRMREHIDLIADFIATRRGELPTAFLPRVVSEAVIAATTAAARYWASTPNAAEPMITYIVAAVRPLLAGYAPELATTDLPQPPER
jgi:AcrR family transcriptional regulator